MQIVAHHAEASAARTKPFGSVTQRVAILLHLVRQTPRAIDQAKSTKQHTAAATRNHVKCTVDNSYRHENKVFIVLELIRCKLQAMTMLLDGNGNDIARVAQLFVKHAKDSIRAITRPDELADDQAFIGLQLVCRIPTP